MTVESEAFALEFLKAPKGKVSAWPTDVAREQFFKVARIALQDTEITWMNPIARVNFAHPSDLLLSKKGDTPWPGYVNEFVFCPVAIDAANQVNLDDAYLKLNTITERDRHVTPKIEGRPLEAPTCFKCEGQSSSKSLLLIDCANPRETHEIVEAGHYKDLLALSYSSFWFLPSHLLSMSAAKSELHTGCLIGTYLGLKQGTTQCACTIYKQNDKVREFVNWVNTLLFLRSLKDQCESFYDVLHEYAKQLHMLRLLEVPLGKLSDALEATQEHSQRLRAILYDPSQSIFAVAPRTLKYFEQDKPIEWGDVEWVALHEPGRADAPARTLNLTLAVIICEIFGKKDPPPKTEAELIERAIRLITSESSGAEDDGLAFSTLRYICQAILDHDNLFAEPALVKRAVVRFKEILYRPFKDGDTKFRLHPLFVVLYGSSPKAEIELSLDGSKPIGFNSLRDSIALSNIDERSLFHPLSLPVPRYAQWLALLQGVTAYAKVERQAVITKATIKAQANQETVVELQFSKSVFDEAKLEDLYKEMKKLFGRRDLSFSAYGNFKKPFMDFVLIAEGLPTANKNTFSIEHSGFRKNIKVRASISITSNSFRYSAERV